jgi:hypothetical protein
VSGESESQFARGVPDDILKRDRSLSFTWRLAHTVGVINGESSRRRLAFFLLQPQWLASECPSQRHGGGAVHYPFYHSKLLLNTANVKVRRVDEVEEPDPGIINHLVCRRFERAPSRVHLRLHELIISRTPFPG